MSRDTIYFIIYLVLMGFSIVSSVILTGKAKGATILSIVAFVCIAAALVIMGLILWAPEPIAEWPNDIILLSLAGTATFTQVISLILHA